MSSNYSALDSDLQGPACTLQKQTSPGFYSTTNTATQRDLGPMRRNKAEPPTAHASRPLLPTQTMPSLTIVTTHNGVSEPRCTVFRGKQGWGQLEQDSSRLVGYGRGKCCAYVSNTEL